MTASKLTGKCRRGHIVTGTVSDTHSLGGHLRCDCGALVVPKFMNVRITDTQCGAKCTSAFGPNCDCSCAGERHGLAHRHVGI